MNPNDVLLFLAVAAGLVTTAFAVSALLCGVIRRHAPRWGFVDRPGGHKGHREPTPMGGGIAIWLTTIILLLVGALVVKLDGHQLPKPLALHVPVRCFASASWPRSSAWPA